MTCKDCIYQCEWTTEPHEPCEYFKNQTFYGGVNSSKNAIDKKTNKFIIKTKFKVGDTVYVADLYHDYYARHMPCVITNIIINITNNNMLIVYCVECGEYMNRLPESWLFSTYEECEKWCEDHN